MSRLTSIAKEFDKAWSTDKENPDLWEFLEKQSKKRVISADEVFAVVLIDQYNRWQAGNPRSLETYLKRCHQVAQVSDMRKRLVLEEFGYLEERDQSPEIEVFLARFREFLTEGELMELRNELCAEHYVSETETIAKRHESIDSIGLPTTTLKPADGSVDFEFEVQLTELPKQIERYQVKKVLGQGGFGKVFLAFDDQLDRQVAIKVPNARFLSRPDEVQAYFNEARIVANLDHENIVPVYDVGQSEEFPCFIVSKYIPGIDLSNYLKKHRVNSYDAAELIATIAEALHFAHQHGIVHRDIKPGNILLDGLRNAYVVDFGLALKEQNVADCIAYAGTPAYMSPEQARGEGNRVDGRSDIYSLGAVMYELLMGCRTFVADDHLQLLQWISERDVKPPRQTNQLVPRELERICMKALSRRVGDRFNTALDMATDLRNFLKLGAPEIPDAGGPVKLRTTRLSFDETAFICRDKKGHITSRIPLENVRTVHEIRKVDWGSLIISAFLIFVGIGAKLLIISTTWGWAGLAVFFAAATIFALVAFTQRYIEIQLDDDVVRYNVSSTLADELNSFLYSLSTQLHKVPLHKVTTEIEANVSTGAVFQQENTPPDFSDIVEGGNKFALDLYQELRKKEGNLFFSPCSISTALAMTYAGAAGETESEMAKTMHFQMPKDQLHAGMKTLQAFWNTLFMKTGFRLNLANRLWGQDRYEYLSTFLQVTRDDYGAELARLNFARTEQARQTINDWVADQTENKITDLLPAGVIDSDARLVLTNAVYFKGSWTDPFKNEITKEEDFHLTSTEKIRVSMMNGSDRYRYSEFDTFQILELPYGDRSLSMVVLLPKEIEGLAELETKLTIQKVRDWTANLVEQEVKVALPKFKTTSQFELRDTLESLGMVSAFDAATADFARMTGSKDLFISTVIHKAFVDVNEEGTEAAAATAVIEGACLVAAEPPVPPIFRADHPFVFMIRDNRNGTILFMGRIANPLGVTWRDHSCKSMR